MRLGFKRDQRCAQTIALPIGFRLPPVARVAGEAEQNFVMAPVLVGLVGVAARHLRGRAGRAQKRQPDGMVIALVRAVLHSVRIVAPNAPLLSVRSIQWCDATSNWRSSAVGRWMVPTSQL